MNKALAKTLHFLSLVCSVFLVSQPDLAFAHPFHSSATEMEWNAETNSFEVAVKLEPNDLEQELRRISGTKVVLEKLPAKEIVFKYVDLVFMVQINTQRLQLKQVGFELTPEAAWIFFELPVPPQISISQIEKLKITNKFLLSQPHQTNTLLLKSERQKISLLFHEKKTEALLVMDEQHVKFVLQENRLTIPN